MNFMRLIPNCHESKIWVFYAFQIPFHCPLTLSLHLLLCKLRQIDYKVALEYLDEVNSNVTMLVPSILISGRSFQNTKTKFKGKCMDTDPVWVCLHVCMCICHVVWVVECLVFVTAHNLFD